MAATAPPTHCLAFKRPVAGRRRCAPCRFILMFLFFCALPASAINADQYTADSVKALKWLYYTNRSDDSVQVKREIRKVQKEAASIERKKKVVREKKVKEERAHLLKVTRIVLSDTALQRGSTHRGSIVLSPHLERPRSAAPVASWIIGITNDTFPGGKLIQLFAGGQLPPASILWYGEALSGGSADTGSCYARMVLLDANNHFEQTPWVRMRILP